MAEDNQSEQRTSREISNDNLIPYKSGESGNPGGRPKYKPISDKIREILEKEYTKDGKTYAEHIAEEVIKELLDPIGNLKHGYNTALLREILDRSEGKVADKHEIETGDISIVYKQVKGVDSGDQ